VAFGKTQNEDLLNFLGAHDIRVPECILTTLRALLAIALTDVMLAQFVGAAAAAALTFASLAIVGMFLYPYLDRLYHWFEERFLANFYDESSQQRQFQIRRALAPWDAHITEFEVPQETPYVGVSLHELSVREKYGVTIAMIERGRLRILAPGRNEVLMPYDGVFVIGNDEQLIKFKAFLDAGGESVVGDDEVFTLEKCEIPAGSSFAHKSIRESGLREMTRGLVVGVERNGRRILNPDGALVLEEGDLLWIVGDRDRILNLDSY
jgi:CPA2 family monovalent cation:H+ antiporter-2